MNSRRGGAVSSNPAASARRASAGEVGLPPPGPPAAVEGRHRLAPVEQGLGQVDRVDDHGLAAADRAHRRERPDRVAQVEQQAADVDEVEASDLVRVEVVDAQLAPLDRRPERVAGELEAGAASLALAERRDHLLR